MPSFREIFNETLVVTRIIHVLTQALLSPSLVRVASKGKALSKGSGTVYKDLFRFWDGYFLSPGAQRRARQIFPENLFRRSRYTHARGPIRLVGIVELQDLFTWPCLLCARVIHFFLLIGRTFRRVVDRAALDSVILYTNFDPDRMKMISRSPIYLSAIALQ